MRSMGKKKIIMDDKTKESIIAYEQWRHKQMYGSISSYELKHIKDSIEHYIKTL